MYGKVVSRTASQSLSGVSGKAVGQLATGKACPRWSPISIGDTIDQSGPAVTEEERVENRVPGLQANQPHTRKDLRGDEKMGLFPTVHDSGFALAGWPNAAESDLL